MYNLAENLALIAQLKSGMRDLDWHNNGEWVDVTDETIARLERENEWLKDRAKRQQN